MAFFPNKRHLGLDKGEGNTLVSLGIQPKLGSSKNTLNALYHGPNVSRAMVMAPPIQEVTH